MGALALLLQVQQLLGISSIRTGILANGY